MMHEVLGMEVKKHKGRSRMTLRYCSNCGRKNLRCKALNGRGLRCKNEPRSCGFCSMHCGKRGIKLWVSEKGFRKKVHKRKMTKHRCDHVWGTDLHCIHCGVHEPLEKVKVKK
jgi:hypothetical protein